MPCQILDITIYETYLVKYIDEYWVSADNYQKLNMKAVYVADTYLLYRSQINSKIK